MNNETGQHPEAEKEESVFEDIVEGESAKSSGSSQLWIILGVSIAGLVTGGLQVMNAPNGLIPFSAFPLLMLGGGGFLVLSISGVLYLFRKR